MFALFWVAAASLGWAEPDSAVVAEDERQKVNHDRSRAIGLTLFCLLHIRPYPAVAQVDAQPANETKPADNQRAQGLQRMVDAAADYELSSDGDSEHLLTRLERPVLRWSNPIRATDDGAVFLWTDAGRPAAALCISGRPSGTNTSVTASRTSPCSQA